MYKNLIQIVKSQLCRSDLKTDANNWIKFDRDSLNMGRLESYSATSHPRAVPRVLRSVYSQLKLATVKRSVMQIDSFLLIILSLLPLFATRVYAVLWNKVRTIV